MVGGAIPEMGNCVFWGFDSDSWLRQFWCKTKRMLGEKTAERYALRVAFCVGGKASPCGRDAPAPLSGIRSEVTVVIAKTAVRGSKTSRRKIYGHNVEPHPSETEGMRHPREFKACLKRTPVPRGRVGHPPLHPSICCPKKGVYVLLAPSFCGEINFSESKRQLAGLS